MRQHRELGWAAVAVMAVWFSTTALAQDSGGCVTCDANCGATVSSCDAWLNACDESPYLCDGWCCGCLGQQQLTGDWWGARTHLAESGITFQGNVTNFYQGVTSGGRSEDSHYAGHGDYVFNFDMSKLGVHEGLFLKVRAEHRFGDTINADTGALLPASIYANLPGTADELLLTNVLFTQMFSPSFGVFFGKLDTLDGDKNAFAHGRGRDQFFNMAFVSAPVALRTVPYSTLGAGFVILNGPEPVFQFSVLNPTDTSTTSGFDELFEEGAVLAAEMRLPTQFFDLPGHQLVGGTWSSRTFTELGQDPRIIIPALNVPIARQDGSWSAYWNFDQYVIVAQDNPAVGWGVFGRAGVADDQTNPLESFLSFGIGGTRPIRGRTRDGFGVGWYRSYTSDEIGPILQALVGPIGDGQGVELFYKIAVTPWFDLTLDLQFIEPAVESLDNAVVPGIRGNLVL